MLLMAGVGVGAWQHQVITPMHLSINCIGLLKQQATDIHNIDTALFVREVS